MTWTSRLENNKLIITTGDGKTYNPLWLDARKNINYNTEGFDFIGVEGTFVQRKEKSGTQFPLTIYFQGESCIEDANAFELSARDKRPWKITHPLYDNFTAQPLSLEIDNSVYNISKITCVVWETIDTQYPTTETNIGGSISELQEAINTASLNDITERLTSPDTSNVTDITSATKTINDAYQNIATTEAEKQDLKNKFREANGAINDFTNDVSSYITKAQALINFPFQSIQTVEFKINKIIESVQSLASIFITNNGSDQSKLLYDTHSTALVAQACSIASNPSDTDYQTKQSVVYAISKINELYEYYLTLFDTALYDQNPDISKDIDLIVNTTLGTLLDIAFDAKQERSIILNKDSNIIILAHKYVGPGDDNLNDFININEIKLSEHLQVKKGRKIKWYVS